MCHGGLFERALGPEHSHTNMCAVRGVRVSAPSRVCASNGHMTLSIARGVQQFVATISVYYFIRSMCHSQVYYY